MLGNLLAAELAPFTVAIGVMVAIALMEAMGTMLGISPSGLVDQLIPDFDADIDIDIDADIDVDIDVDIGASVDAGAAGGAVPTVGSPDADVDADGALDLGAATTPAGPLTQILGWLCIGRVPILVLLVAFLTTFGLTGIIVQSLISSIAGTYLPTMLAVLAALGISLPMTRRLALGLARIMPKEETEAVSTRSFIGKVAIITQGLARKGMPAQAKLSDVHGQQHYVLVEPDDALSEFEQGTEVLLLAQTSHSRFTAIRNTNALMSNSGSAV